MATLRGHQSAFHTLSMPSFFHLPRELRDYIYEECLQTQIPIDLRNLADEQQWPPHQRLGLCPSLLQTCRNIMEEGLHKLYGENTFFMDLRVEWQLPPNQPSCTHSQSNLETSPTCHQALRCEALPLGILQPTFWSPLCARISKVQISPRQYTYSEWKYRIPANLSSATSTRRSISSVFPSGLRLKLLSVRIQERSMIPVEEVHCLRSWQAVAFGYNHHDAEHWRKQGYSDLRRITAYILHVGRRCAETVLLYQPDSLPRIITTTPTTQQRPIRKILCRSAGSVQVPAVTANEQTSGYFSRLQQKVHEIANNDGHDQIISVDGLTMITTSMNL